ncbi:DDB1- and CUL4-associated factor 8 [Olea europaea var. sylvestris]|uniref:DDB1- and CUL4-associated factor 8-like n=1 Tax=Olea europaea subsp. europaea TaxID=158383 RepID=A0A8S0TYW3_OLEEU|nr:DDB1- and CUL4-associated factor 8 [Olea europaea var. sylvestris]CAA3011576.1 DDB1- and CUL4-associated factor 8-like [Olea europaea subsp. europaea]
MEKPYKNSGNGLIEFFKRELGFSPPSTFSSRISASQSLVKRMDLYGKLNGHQGCVNTIEFNSSGDLLVSGSDDKQIIFWDWAAQKLKFVYPSGHLDNIFQARIMPFTDDRKIVTSSADCQVRLGEVLENGQLETKRLAKHQGRVHNLAVEPGSPYIFYSCGEDGFVQHYDLRSKSATKLFNCSSFTEDKQSSSSNIGLNAIVIDPRNPNYFGVGGADAYARVYDIRKYQLGASTKEGSPFNTFCPRHLIRTNDVHITALAYSHTSELLISYNDELIYLFQKNLGLGPNPFASQPEDLQKLVEVQTYSGHRNSQTVKGVNFFGPNDEYVLSGSDCGHVFIWKKKGAELVRLMVGDRHIVNQLEPHPIIPVLATCGLEKSIKLWAPSTNVSEPLPENVLEIMEANKRGREDHSRVSLTPDVIMHVLRLHRRQAQVYIERRYNREDIESDEDGEGGAYVLGFSDGEASEDNGVPRECIIS